METILKWGNKLLTDPIFPRIVASNNLSDVLSYTQEFKLAYKTTRMILVEALQQHHITETEGNALWFSMLRKKRRLGAASFSEYLADNVPF